MTGCRGIRAPDALVVLDQGHCGGRFGRLREAGGLATDDMEIGEHLPRRLRFALLVDAFEEEVHRAPTRSISSRLMTPSCGST